LAESNGASRPLSSGLVAPKVQGFTCSGATVLMAERDCGALAVSGWVKVSII